MPNGKYVYLTGSLSLDGLCALGLA
ncbi:uncharacterized protein METZ01_LOCUS482027, partial [marine metagenome]